MRTEGNGKRFEEVRTLGEMGDFCFSAISLLANDVASIIEDVETECHTGRFTAMTLSN